MFRTLIAGALTAGVMGGAAAAADSATATMQGPDGTAMGTVTLTQGPNGVLVSARLTGLSEGPHGFHIHENGTCEPDFGAAGGHYNPAGTGHGVLAEGGHHAGDLPNIIAMGDGAASADYFTGDITLGEGSNSVFDDNGSTIIVHEGPDSYGAEAGAGGRVACGVITAN